MAKMSVGIEKLCLFTWESRLELTAVLMEEAQETKTD